MTCNPQGRVRLSSVVPRKPLLVRPAVLVRAGVAPTLNRLRFGATLIITTVAHRHLLRVIIKIVRSYHQSKGATTMDTAKKQLADVTVELNEYALAYVAESREEIYRELPTLGADICDILARGLIPEDEKDKWSEHVAKLIRYHAVITEAFDTLMKIHSNVLRMMEEARSSTT